VTLNPLHRMRLWDRQLPIWYDADYRLPLTAFGRRTGLEPRRADLVAWYLLEWRWITPRNLRSPVRIRYEDPKAVGADRVVDAVAVRALYGGPACVVDFGTATTFDAISAEGDYLGGAISPGIGIAAEALFQRTAKLPRVDLARPPAAIGRNTVFALQSGLVFGYVGLVEGMVARFREELGPKMKVIGTGGLVDLIAAETPVIEIKAPWLTLDGLRIVWALNQE